MNLPETFTRQIVEQFIGAGNDAGIPDIIDSLSSSSASMVTTITKPTIKDYFMLLVLINNDVLKPGSDNIEVCKRIATQTETGFDVVNKLALILIEIKMNNWIDCHLRASK